MRAIVVAGLLLSTFVPTQAAQVFTENFTTGGMGWVLSPGSLPNGFLGGAVRMRKRFEPVATPSYLIATNVASGGSFTGNYASANIHAIGFSIISTTVVPNELLIQLENGTTNISCSIAGRLSVTGLWTKLICSLDSAQMGPWTESSPGCFTSVLANVKSVVLSLKAPSANPGDLDRFYQIDDFFLAQDTPLLAVEPSACAFPELLVGQSAQQTLTLTNAGTLPLTGTVRIVPPGAFSLVGATNYSIAAGGATNITVDFTAGSAGHIAGKLVLLSDGGAQVASLSGTGLDGPVLGVSPASQSLGDVVTGTVAYATIVATNSGGSALTGTASVVGAPFAVTQGVTFVLNAGASTNVLVSFSPPVAQAYTAEVTFSSNGGNSTSVVTGTGFDGPILGLFPAAHDFGVVPHGIAESFAFLVTNRGSQVLDGTAAAGGSPFAVSDGAAFAVPPGGWTNVVVVFTPDAETSYTNSLEVLSNGGNSTGTLTGAGTNLPFLGVAPATLDFGEVQTGLLASASFVVSNAGFAALHVTSVVAGSIFTITNGADLALAPGEAHNVTVQFAPASPQAYSNFVFFASDGGFATGLVQGVGVAPAVPGVSPAGWYFGLVPVGEVTQVVFVVTNASVHTLAGTAAVAASPFAVVSGAAFELSPGGWSNVVVSFTPPHAAPFAADLLVTGPGGVVTNALSGEGILPTAGSTNLYLVRSGGAMRIAFEVSPGAWYHLQTATNLVDPGWLDLGGTNRALTATAVYTDAVPSEVIRFYRLRSP